MKLATSILKRFDNATKNIKTGDIIPILGYWLLSIKDGIGTLHKSNLGQHCVYEFEAMGEVAILLEEVIIQEFVKSSADEIDVVLSDDHKSIRIFDGVMDVTFQSLPPNDFPKLPAASLKPKISIPKAVLSSLGIARHFSAPQEKNTNFSFVYTTKNAVAAFQQVFLYFKEHEGSLPEICLSQASCNILSGYENATYQQIDNFDVFDVGNPVYAFVRPTHSPLPFSDLAEKITDVGGVTLSRTALVNFVDMTKRIAKYDPSPTCTLSDHADGMLISYSNAELALQNKCVIPAEKRGVIPDFSFNAKELSSGLQALPYDLITLAPAQSFNDQISSLGITTPEDKLYKGMIASIIKS